MNSPSTAISIASLAGVAALAVGALIGPRLIGNPRRVSPVGQRTGGDSGRSRLVPLLRSRLLVVTLMIALGLLTVGLFPIVLLLVFWLSVKRAIPLLGRARHQRDIERALPGTIELLVLSIHAGLTPDQAIRELSGSAHPATRPAFVAVVTRMDRGEALVDALATLPDKLGPSAVSLAEVIGSSARYGVALSQVLEQLSAEARNGRRRLDEAAARRLPVRLSFPLVVCTLPSFVLLAIAPAVIAALSSLGVQAL